MLTDSAIRAAARRHLAVGIDPSSQRPAEKLAAANTFEAVAREWLAQQDKKLAPLLFVRPGELRHAEWTEFDLNSAEPLWRIPAEKMKREQHIVPLSTQSLGLVCEIQSVTGRGFRSLASTRLNEQGYQPDLIELHLAHAERNQVRAAYNKAQRLPERRKMMQAWAVPLDRLSAGANVVPFKRVAG